TVQNLFPGKAGNVAVYIKNTNQSTIYVTSLTVASGATATSNVTKAPVGTCPASLLAFTNLSNVHIPVPTTSKSSAGTPITVPVTLAASTPDPCANVTWPLTFTGTASSS